MPRSGGTSKKSILETTRIPLWTPIPEIPEDKLPGKLSDILRFNFLRWDEIFALIHRLVRWYRLDFWMQHQQQTNWCWAAVATSVSHFFNPASTWTQCAVANGELNRNDCCGSGASGPCNVYGFLGSSLTRVGHHDHTTSGTATFAQVQAEVDGGRPLCARTAWSGGGAHFLAIIGYRSLGQMLAVDDPWYGKSDVSYTTFLTSYQGSGSWTHSYYTTA
jgi:hypothetical protein